MSRIANLIRMIGTMNQGSNYSNENEENEVDQNAIVMSRAVRSYYLQRQL